MEILKQEIKDRITELNNKFFKYDYRKQVDVELQLNELEWVLEKIKEHEERNCDDGK